MSVKIADAYISVTTDQAGFDGALKGLLGSTSAWSVAVGTLVADALKGVANLVIDAGKAMVGFLTDSISKAAEFEQGMADVRAVMTLTNEEAAKLEDLALDLGMDPSIVVTGKEAVGVIKDLGAAGVSAEEMINGTAKATIQLANATGGDLATAAKVVTMLTGVFQVKQEDLGKAIDSVTGTINESKMSLMDYKYMIGQGGPAMASFGITVEDMNASIAATNDGFTSGQTHGTGWRTMILRTIPTTVKQKDMMVELGLATKDAGVMTEEATAEMEALEAELAALDPAAEGYDEKVASITKKQDKLIASTSVLNNHFFDERGEFIGLRDMGNLLQEKLGHLTEEQKNHALAVLFGVRGMQAASVMMENSGPVYDEMYNRVNNLTSAAESAAIRNKTLSGSWEVLQGIMETIQIQIGRPFLDALQRLNLVLGNVLYDGAEPLIETFARMGRRITLLIDESIIPFVERYGPSIMDMFNEWLDILIEFIPRPEEIATKMRWLGDTILWVGEKIGDWIQGGLLFIQAMIQMKDQTDGFIGKIMAIAQPIIDVIFQFVSWKDVLIVATAVLVAIISPILVLIAKLALITAGVAIVRTAWEADWGYMRTFLTGAFGEIMKTLQVWADFLHKVFVTDTGEWTASAKRFFQDMQDTFQQVFRLIADTVGLIASLMRGDWASAWQYAKDIAEANMKLVEQGAGRWLEVLRLLFVDKSPPIGKALPDGIQKGIADGTPATEQAVKSYGQRVIDNFKGIFGISSPSTVFAGFGRDITAGLAQGLSDISALLSAARDMANRLIAEVKASFAIDWSGIGRSIIDGIKGGIAGGVASITDAAKAAAQSAVDAAKAALETGSPSKKAAREVGLPFAQGVGIGALSGLSGIKDKIQTGIGNMMPDMRSVLGGGGGVDMSGIEAAIGGISGSLGGGGVTINQNYYIQGGNTAGVTDAAYNGTKKALRQVGLR